MAPSCPRLAPTCPDADFQLRQACKTDARSVCGAKTQTTADMLDGMAFRCLVDNVGSLGDACAAELARAARTGLAFYAPVRLRVLRRQRLHAMPCHVYHLDLIPYPPQPDWFTLCAAPTAPLVQGLPAVEACDPDVARLCSPPAPTRNGPAPWPLGAVSECLWTEVEQDREASSAAADVAVSAAASGQTRRAAREAPADGANEQGSGEEQPPLLLPRADRAGVEPGLPRVPGGGAAHGCLPRVPGQHDRHGGGHPAGSHRGQPGPAARHAAQPE